MTKREIIFTVIEKIRAHSDDSSVTEEFISSMIDTKRAMLLKQQFSKAVWNIPIEIKQEICMPLELVDVIAGYSGGGKILKSSIALPRTIKIKGQEGPLLVRKEDGSALPINIIPIDRLPFLGANRYTAMLTYAALDIDGKLILISADNKLNFLKSIRVTHIFESPDNAYSLECSDNGSDTLEPWDIDYPVEAAMIDTIVEMIMKDLTKTLSIPEDNTNNARDDRG